MMLTLTFIWATRRCATSRSALIPTRVVLVCEISTDRSAWSAFSFAISAFWAAILAARARCWDRAAVRSSPPRTDGGDEYWPNPPASIERRTKETASRARRPGAERLVTMAWSLREQTPLGGTRGWARGSRGGFARR